MIKLGSLFDGSGGFPLAGCIHGVTPVWASEIEPYPVRVTTARFPAMKHLGDVTKINGAEVEPVDIITFGSPCQDLSVAGKQAGLHKGERSNLFFEAIRIIKEMRESTDGIYPRIAVWENVPGAYSSNKGEDFRAVLQAFCEISDPDADVPEPPQGKWSPSGAIVGDGWSVAWRTFDAQYWGVPQRRKRIYLIADFGSERAGEVLFEQEGVRGDSAPGGTAGEGTAGDAAGSVGRGCGAIVFKERAGCPGGGKGILCGDKPFTLSTLTDQAVCYALDQQGGKGGANYSENIAPPLMSDSHGTPHGVCYAYDQYNGAISDKQPTLGVNCGLSTGRNGVCYAAGFKAGQSKDASLGYQEECAATLSAHASGTEPTVCYALQGNGIDRADTAGCNGAGWRENECYTLNTIDRPAVCYPINTMVATRHKADDGRTTFGVGDNGDPQFTIGAAHEHAVCYSLDRAAFNQGINAKYDICIEPELNSPLMARGPSAVCYPIDSHQQDSRFRVCEDGVCPTVPGQMGTGGNNGPMVLEKCTWDGSQVCSTLTANNAGGNQRMPDKENFNAVIENGKPPRKYIIRRLTPLECCRLQGFPDWWCSGIEIENPTEEEIAFWAEVWETHRRTMGRSGKAKSRKQIIKWLNDPYSDAAEYKMWGNGLALPNAAHVVGCAVKLIKETQT